MMVIEAMTNYMCINDDFWNEMLKHTRILPTLPALTFEYEGYQYKFPNYALLDKDCVNVIDICFRNMIDGNNETTLKFHPNDSKEHRELLRDILPDIVLGSSFEFCKCRNSDELEDDTDFIGLEGDVRPFDGVEWVDQDTVTIRHLNSKALSALRGKEDLSLIDIVVAICQDRDELYQSIKDGLVYGMDT